MSHHPVCSTGRSPNLEVQGLLACLLALRTGQARSRGLLCSTALAGPAASASLSSRGHLRLQEGAPDSQFPTPNSGRTGRMRFSPVSELDPPNAGLGPVPAHSFVWPSLILTKGRASPGGTEPRMQVAAPSWPGTHTPAARDRPDPSTAPSEAAASTDWGTSGW